MNPFPYADDNKRYHTLAYANRRRFGGRVYKAALDAGLTCPNLDGSRGVGGCLFCGGGSGYFTAASAVSIPEQLGAELSRIRAAHPEARAIAYFQAHTNTYAPLPVLKALYEAALSHPLVCGISIATRADALPEPVLDYLEELSNRTALTVELGLQTIHDETARALNRCHSYAEFLKGYGALKRRGIPVCVHLINGLPGEDAERMLQTAKAVGMLRPDAVKLHLLHVITGTKLAELYTAGRYTPMTLDGYVDIVVRQLEVLPPATVIQRLTGDGDRRTLLAPRWSRDKIRVLGSIDRLQAARGSWQGKALAEQP